MCTCGPFGEQQGDQEAGATHTLRREYANLAVAEGGGCVDAVRREARAILDQFTRDAYLTRFSIERARWGEWEQVTPAWVLLLSLKSLLLLRWEEGRSGPELIPELPAGVSRAEADRLVEALLGSLTAARVARNAGTLTLEGVLPLLAGVIAEEAMTDQEIDRLLRAALEIGQELVHAGDLLRAAYRGLDVGPWDVSEAGWQELDLIDLGGLRIPREQGLKIQLRQAGAGTPAGEVAVLRGTTAALQLQAFRLDERSGWDAVRAALESEVRARGGEAEQWSGRVGVELRAVVPVVSDARGRDSVTVRFLGCDGPGWLLRGVVGGEVAQSESRDDWAYAYFERVVVDPSYVPPAPSVSASPGIYAPASLPQPGQVISLRMPPK